MKQHHSDSGYDGSEAKMPSVSPYEIDIRVYLDALSEGKYKILLIGLSVTVLTILYLLIATPTYSSNVLLQFMDKGSNSEVLGEISDALATRNSVVDAEVEIIKSRRILGSAIEQLRLDVIIEPKTFPLIGKYLLKKRMKSQGEPAQLPSRWGGGKQRWGDSEIAIESLAVGSGYIDKKLTLVSVGDGKYKLLGPDGSLLLEGETGKQLVVGKSRSKEELTATGVDILISALDVEPGAEFYLTVKTRQFTLKELLKVLTITEEGKDSSILKISMEGKDPRHIANILSTIVENYLEYSLGSKARELQNMLVFVQKETALIRQRLERSETALVDYLSSHDSAGLSAEITKLINNLTSIESQITELEIQLVGSQSKYTKDHPVMLAITRKIDLLESEKTDIDRRLKQLPEKEREKEALSRDAEVEKQLLILLQTKEQVLGVALSGITSTFQVIDPAQISSAPIKPKKLLVIGAGIIFGLFLGVLYVIGRRAMNFGIEDPDVIENELQMPVYAVIVHSRLQAGLDGQAGLLAKLQPSDPAIEGLRRLCASIKLFEKTDLNNVINISSPAPDAGVSFIGSNLAQLLADSGMNVLLVDADLRGGEIEKDFGASQTPGLTDYLQKSNELQDIVRKVSQSNSGTLNFVARGTSINNSAELLMSDRFADFVQACSASYEMVVFVTPPVTAVTDSAIVSKYADRNFLVVRYGKQSKREIKAARKVYNHAGIKNKGVIFNAMIERRRDGYSYSYRREA